MRSKFNFHPVKPEGIKTVKLVEKFHGINSRNVSVCLPVLPFWERRYNEAKKCKGNLTFYDFPKSFGQELRKLRRRLEAEAEAVERLQKSTRSVTSKLSCVLETKGRRRHFAASFSILKCRRTLWQKISKTSKTWLSKVIFTK